MAMHSSTPFLSFVLLALFLPAAAVARTTSSLTAGDALTPPNYITSPSGDFAFGFRSLDSTASSSYLLAIWFRFHGLVVWFATDADSGSAVVATRSSVLSFSASGQLSLDNTMWNPYTDQIQNYGSLLVLRDDGNLQFVGADGTTVVWESFQHPTDTLLPGQLMRPGTHLRSRGTYMDVSLQGRFNFMVQTDGNIVLYMMDMTDQPSSSPANAYWNTFTCCVGNTTLFFDAERVGHLYYVLTDGSKHNLTIPQVLLSTTRFYQHARIDPDGIFRVYVIPKNSTGKDVWDIVDLFPHDGCKSLTNNIHGMCGPNSYCINRTDNNRLDCECPSDYVFIDSQFRHKGCIPAFLQDACDGNSHASEFKLVELPNTYWASSVYFKKAQSITEEECSGLCLNNCLCAAALFDGNSCSEAIMLTAGWEANDTTMRTLIKVRTKGPTLRILPYVVIASLSVLFMVSTCILLVHCYVTSKQNNARKNYLSVTVFTRKELYRATNGFSKLLGQGGFGKVYHGIVKSLQPADVAVKELKSGDEYTETEFENEVQSIGRIHHKNLVRMVGYCKEGAHRMLVFEFMPRGSLYDFLFRSSERPPWSWRAEAAVSIARGLEYLHYGCTTQIIHCDIKPDNILLDDKYDPKITDFGIARLLGDNKVKQTITHVRGTLGYLAPEWSISSERKVDNKVDVYSFGVMLLEMICCKRFPDQDRMRYDDGGSVGSDDDDLGMPVTLRAWVKDMLRGGNTERIVQGDGDALQDLQRVERFARIAIWCVQVDPSMRPTMRSVVWMLEGTVSVAPLPDAPTARDDFSASSDSRYHSNVE